MNRKGITPVISSISLLLFAIGLGILVMSWGTQSENHDNRHTTCSDTGIEIIKINNKDEVCRSDNNLLFTIENAGSKILSGLKVSIMGEKDIYQKDLTLEIKPGEIKRSNIQIEPYNIRQVRIAPIIENEKICTEKTKKTEQISIC